MSERLPEITKEFGAAVKRRREALGIKQADLATKAGTSPTTLSSIENGKTATNLAEIARLSEALQQAPWELLRPPGATPTPSRESLLGDIVLKLAALNEDQLRFVLPFVDAARSHGAVAGQPKKLGDNLG